VPRNVLSPGAIRLPDGARGRATVKVGVSVQV
jgi:hypothetical protein